MTGLWQLLKLADVSIGRLFGAVVAASVTLLSALLLTVLSGWLITRAWEMPPVLELGVAITAVRALGISRAVFRYVDRLISHRLALSALTTLRARLFDAIAHNARASAVLTSRGAGFSHLVSDADRVTDLIVRTLVPGGVALVLSIGSIAFTAFLHSLAAAILTLGFVLTGVLTPWLALRSSRRGKHLVAEDELIIRIDQALSNRAEVEAAGLGDAHAAATAEASARYSAATVQAERPEALGAAIQSWATGLAAAGILAVAVMSYAGDPTWMGMLIMVPLAAFEAHGQLAKAAVHADEASRSASRLLTLTGGGEIPQPRDHLPGVFPIKDAKIHAENLMCQFGDTPWNFTLKPGQRMVVRGPSGCGKTTLLCTLAGLLPERAGKVTLADLPLWGFTDPQLRTSIRAHVEDEWVFATSIAENIRVANPYASEHLIAEVLDAVGLSTWVGGLEDGIHTVLADGAGSLSSGQRRRLLLARALCSTAAILLIDEPTEHIDADSARELLNTLLKKPLPGARAERSVIVVTHASPGDITVDAEAISVEIYDNPV